MSLVSAVLGPTNTGKTHQAMARMLAHPTGVMGFPLRLLARENYERLVDKLGPDRVALVTGEERILPPRPDYWLSTTEAMPQDVPTAFVGVDEIQLCGHPARGHVFTDRLLNARGTRETMFCGADTVRDVMLEITPHVQVEARPRRSSLAYTGHASLGALPARSCVVAFSARDVYRIAEKVRRKRGGAAVVLGALSPRARNAQVELFQSGRVDVLVATDAVGMGLNLDIHHVAFAATRKFDGRRVRRLSAAELGQIAGRAGRNLRDGTFGTCDEAAPLHPDVVRAIEEHRFDPVPFVWYRNSALDFDTPDALLRSLKRAPTIPRARRRHDAVDQHTFAQLIQDPSVVGDGLQEADVRRLWAVCQVPDYRQALHDGHVGFCRQLYTHLRDRGTVPSAVIERALSRLADTDVETEVLTGRLNDVRTWAYVVHRPGWVEHAAAQQARTAAIEERVSDALHDRLTARFIDELKRVAVRRTDDELSALLIVDEDGVARIEGQPVAEIAGLLIKPHPGAGRDRLRIARRALRPAMAARARALLSADVDRFVLDADTLRFDGAPVGRLRRGKRRFAPEVTALVDELIDEHAPEVTDKLRAVTALRVEEVFGALVGAEGARTGGPAQAVLYRLVEGFGVVGRREMNPTLATLDEDAKRALRGQLVKIGQRTVSIGYRAGAVAFAWRWALSRLWRGEPVEALPVGPGPVSCDVALLSRYDAEALGFVRMGAKLYRVDALERVAGLVQKAARKGAFELDEAWCSRLSATRDEVAAVLSMLGFRAGAGGYVRAGKRSGNKGRGGKRRR